MEVNEGELNNCLVCNSSINSISECGPIPPKISDELNVIFILQNILELPRDTLGRFLKKWGNPSEWEVTLCENCGDAISNAKRIYGEMLASMRKYKEVKKDIVEKVRGSVDRNRGRTKIARDIAVTAESRAFVCTHEYCVSSDPFVEGDKMARDALDTGRGLWVKTEPVEEEDRDDASDNSLDFGGDLMDAEDNPESEEDRSEIPQKVAPGIGAGRPCPKSKKSKIPPCPPSKNIVPVKNRPNLETTHARDTSRSDGIFCKCGRSYQSNSGLKMHILNISDLISGVTHECELCKNANPSVSRTFSWKQELRRHILDYHEGRRSICPLCGKAFIPKKLARHMRQVHDHRL